MALPEESLGTEMDSPMEVRQGATARRRRVIMAKVGLDSHDLGVRYLSRKLSEEGFEVIFVEFYEPTELVNACIQENADILGISSMTGSHLQIVQGVMDEMRRRALEDIPVVVGGIIPIQDHQTLREMGARQVFSTGSKIEEILNFFKQI